MEHNLLPRIGTFLILISLGLLVLFLGSVFSGGMLMRYFLLSVVTFFLGTLLRRHAPHNDSGRFGSIRQMRGKNRKSSEEKK